MFFFHTQGIPDYKAHQMKKNRQVKLYSLFHSNSQAPELSSASVATGSLICHTCLIH